jgi:hypothetical protein
MSPFGHLVDGYQLRDANGSIEAKRNKHATQPRRRIQEEKKLNERAKETPCCILSEGSDL